MIILGTKNDCYVVLRLLSDLNTMYFGFHELSYLHGILADATLTQP